MADNRCSCSQGSASNGARETVYIDTMRVLDSCRDRDCYENVRVYLTPGGQELIDRTLAALDATGKKFEFIMIDDGSRDSSREIITRAAEARPDQVIGCILNRNYGQHSAIMAGFSIVRGDLIITLDADLQNPPEEIPRSSTALPVLQPVST